MAVYVGLLTAEPVAIQGFSVWMHKTTTGMHECCKRKHATENKTTGKPLNSNCCANGTCNPFGSGCCFFEYKTFVRATARIWDISKSKTTPPTENKLYSSFVSSCFHPPEAV